MSKHDFPASEFAERRERVETAAGEAGFDCLVLFHPVSIHWLIGSDAKSYQAFQCLLVFADGRAPTMVVRESERAEIEADTLAEEVVTWGGSEPEDPVEVFARLVAALPDRRIGMEVPPYYLHPHHYVRLRQVLGERLAGEPSALVHDLKLVKSTRELEYVRRAAEIADAAMADMVAVLETGRTELELAGEVYRSLLTRGSGFPASTLNLVSGPRSAFSHGAPTERRLAPGDFGNVEFGAAYRRYTATIGRQFAMGEPTARMRELYEVVRAAQDAMMAAIGPGVPATVPHEAAKRVIARAGLDRYRIHTSGYGIAPGFPPSWGEPVNMFGGNRYTLAPGMVLTVEPPVFIPEEGLGARLIDNVIVTQTGIEPITAFPRDLVVVA